MHSQRISGFSLGLVAAVVLVCASFFPATASATNIVLNPSFEIGSGSLPNSCGAGCSYSLNGGSSPNPDSTTIPDWTISSFTLGAGVYVPNFATGLTPVPDGSAVAFTSGGEIYQGVGTVVDGDTYTLTAWIANGGPTSSYNKFVPSVGSQ